jgi:hypothetical protein
MPIALIVLVVTLAGYANCCRFPNAVGGLQIALLIVSPILLLLAAGLAMLALRSIQADTAAMDRLWTDRPPQPAQPVPI